MADLAYAENRERGELSLLACVADDVTKEAVSRAAGLLDWPAVKVRTGGLPTAHRFLEAGHKAKLILIDLSDAEDPAQALDDFMQLLPPGTRCLAIGKLNDLGLYRAARSMGAADYLAKPVSSELLKEALAAALKTEVREKAAKDGKTVVFLGSRGGTGSSTLAAATAWCLANDQRQSVALLDLDLHFGTLALSLDLEPGRGLRDALEHPERIDGLLVASAMARQGERLKVLAAEEHLDEPLHFDRAAAAPLLGALRNDFDSLVIDLPRSLDAVSRQVLAIADTPVLVTDLSLAGLRDTVRLMELLKVLGARGTPLIVANQVGAIHRGEIGQGEFEKGLKAKLDYIVPFDAKAALAMARQGKALPAAAASSKATVELRRFVQRIGGSGTRKPRSFLKKIWGS